MFALIWMWDSKGAQRNKKVVCVCASSRNNNKRETQERDKRDTRETQERERDFPHIHYSVHASYVHTTT